MNEITVVVEKTKTGFCANSSEFVRFKLEAPSLELLKLNVKAEVSALLLQKIEQNRFNSVAMGKYPKIRFAFNVKKLLDQIHPFVKHKALADFAGLTPITLSHYQNGHKSPTEKNFMKLLDGLRAITMELIVYN